MLKRTYHEVEKILRERENDGEFDNEFVGVETILNVMRDIMSKEGLSDDEPIWRVPITTQHEQDYDRAMRGVL